MRSEYLRLNVQKLQRSFESSKPTDRIIVDYVNAPLIRTGLQSLDLECSGGGHLIGLIGSTGSGKTSIMNTIKAEAEKNGISCIHVQEHHNYDDFMRAITSPAKIKLIDWKNPHPLKWMNNLRELRSNLIANNQWAVISIQSRRSQNEGDFNGVGIPNSVLYMADFLFHLNRLKSEENQPFSISTVENIKNRQLGDPNRPSKFFKISCHKAPINGQSYPIAKEIHNHSAKYDSI